MTQLELPLDFQSQHAFELCLEQMLVEVENGAEWAKEEKQKKAKNRKEAKRDDKKKVGKHEKSKEKPSPGWQKIWYKRLG